ncbi:FtsX-like permease family protein [Haloglycomyces albus]|uniref:FtsX-like permease family protein n=1 Tax=Haloglycomyces albus TaxID=526067 RepID=UPI00046D77B9|nr:ABC transporter permease [Haloglycomyces albus]
MKRKNRHRRNRLPQLRRSGLIAVALAALGGAMLIVPTLIVAETSLRWQPGLDHLMKADIIVAADQEVDVPEDLDISLPQRATVATDLADDIATIDGVGDAWPEISFPVAGLAEQQTGYAWRDGITDLEQGRSPEGEDEVAASTNIDAVPGDRLDLVVNGNTTTVTVVGTVSEPGLYFDSATANSFYAKTGHADFIAVNVNSTTDLDAVTNSIDTTVADSELHIYTGKERGQAQAPPGQSTTLLFLLTNAVGGTLLLLVGFIVAAAISVAVAGQRHELALLRLIGATPAKVRNTIASQASRAALIGAIPGIAAGYLLAPPFLELIRAEGFVPDALSLTWSPIPAVAFLVLLVAVVHLAARAAALSTSRQPAIAAVRDSTTEPKTPGQTRTTAGIALTALALTTMLVPLFARTEAAFIAIGSAVIPAVIGFALAGPRLWQRLGRHLRRQRRTVTAELAVANVHTFPMRMSGATTVLVLAISLTVSQVSSKTTLAEAQEHDMTEGFAASTTTITAQQDGAIGLPTLHDVRTLPGVERAAIMATTTVISDRFDGMSAHQVKAVTGDVNDLIDPDVTDGKLRLTGSTVAIDTTTSWMENAEVGDSVSITLPNGTEANPDVVAVYQRGMGFGPYLLSADLLPDGSTFDTVLTSGGSEAVTAWSAEHPAVTVLDEPPTAADTSGLTLDSIIALAILAYVLLGIANNLVAGILRRRKEFHTLLRLGASRRQVRAMTRYEVLLLCLMAVAASGVLTILPTSLLGLVFLGEPWPHGPAWYLPATITAVVAITYAAMMLPTRLAYRST